MKINKGFIHLQRMISALNKPENCKCVQISLYDFKRFTEYIW